MKANAPDKIYLHIRPNKEIGSTWHGNKISDTDIEYTRTDAFIEKAATWIANRYQANGSYLCANDIDEFKNYMREEL